MQKYHATGCTSAVSNNTIGGSSAKDTVRGDSSSLPVNFALNPRLGPPDHHPQTPNCPEETLTKDYLQNGYRETVEGLEESREISLTQVQIFTKPVVLKCKEAIKKRLRAINDSRAQKRKAGQVYGVPLSGSLLTKPGIFPDQKPCSEDFRKRWIEGLSQPHKRLRSLSEHIPHGYRKRTLIEVLIKNNVPLLRATWFIKVTYLNQVRSSSVGISSVISDKTQFSRSELWTKDIIDYLKHLLDEFFSRNNSHSAPHGRDRSPQMFYAGSLQHKGDQASVFLDRDEPSLHFKWCYVVRLLQWHHSEGLLLPSLIISWVINQLQERELLEIWQFLLPIIYGVIETIVLSQTYVRDLVAAAIRYIKEPSPGGSDLVDNSRRAYTTSAVIEMLRYLLLAVPDTFVGLDCFPLPPCVVSYAANDSAYLPWLCEDARKVRTGFSEVACFRDKGLDSHYKSSLNHVVAFIKKRAENLAKAATSGYPGHGVAKAVLALDKVVTQGDVVGAYKFLFEDMYDGVADEGWMAEVNPHLRSSLTWIETVSLPFICSVFFLCEWATCDFRDFRMARPHGLRFTGRKEFSQVYIAIQILKIKLREIHDSVGGSSCNSKGFGHQIHNSGNMADHMYDSRYKGNSSDVVMDLANIFSSPGPFHDIIVCWLDQHEATGDGFERVQLFIMELTRSGIFYPPAYARQLMVSGYMDRDGPLLDRRKRHYRLLKQLPARFTRDALLDAGVAAVPFLEGAMHTYVNERRLVLRGLLYDQSRNIDNASSLQSKLHTVFVKEGSSPLSVEHLKASKGPPISLNKGVKTHAQVEELKVAICILLQLPQSSSSSSDTIVNEHSGSVKRSAGLSWDKPDQAEGTPGCEECSRVKRQKLSDERNSPLQMHSPSPPDDEDIWWVRKGFKPVETFKVEPLLKPTKQGSKGRQKMVRKTQSLAQLQAGRIEGSQGASTSHVCDSKSVCPQHGTGVEVEASKSSDATRSLYGDVVSIGKALKELHFVEKRSLSVWMIDAVKQLVEETEKILKVSQFSRPLSADQRSSKQWKLGEDELSSILYLMDISNDLVLAARFLLWLMPKVPNSLNPSSSMHGGRNVLMMQKNMESHVCIVGEAFLFSSIRRYENILNAVDLVPEALTAAMHRAAAVISSNGRISGSAALVFVRYLLKRYGNVTSVLEWEKNFKASCDRRVLSELETRSLDGEYLNPLGVPAGVEDLDDFFRQKISNGRLSRVGSNMRDLVQKHMEDAVHHFLSKERKSLAAGVPKNAAIEKWNDGYQKAQLITTGLMECMRQTGGTYQEEDPSLVSSAVSAIICNVGHSIGKVPDFSVGSSFSGFPSASGALSFARYIIRMLITCLLLLKEALGERQSRVFEIALATEASSALSVVFAPGKASRGQAQLFPDARDSASKLSNEILNNSAKGGLGRAVKIAASISALIIGSVIQGVTSLERMINVLRIKDGLDVAQFIRSTKSNSNGNSRSAGSVKVESSIETYVHWFRLLIGNCRTLCDGLIVDLVGEPSIVALFRMQQTLSVNLIFPPAYSIFAFVVWRPFIFGSNIANREDGNQLYKSLTSAIGDAILHLPFRDACLRDTHGFYAIVAADASDTEFAAMLEMNGLDKQLKAMTFIPLRARLFLNALIDCKLPTSASAQDDGNHIVSGHGELKARYAENESELLENLVHVLDTLQPAKFHWQWVELRLLLNEQALLEKLDTHDKSLSDILRSLSPSEKATASENENNFIEIILTRLLVRPDAAPLFSEVVHLFGRSLEDSMLLQAKWFLGGHDVLFGRKSIRQRLINIAESKGLSTKPQFWKSWGWTDAGSDLALKREKRSEISTTEEGEVLEEGTGLKRCGKGSIQMVDAEVVNISEQQVTERALTELLLPCIDQSSDDSRGTFASDLIKQMSNIEQQVTVVTRATGKQSGSVLSGHEGPASKGNNRKGIRGGSPGLARRQTVTVEFVPPSPAALRASMCLRLEFILRLLPFICADREPYVRSMRHTLARVILHILGSPVVYEDADLLFPTLQCSTPKREADLLEFSPTAASENLSAESVFDRLLLVFHGLLGSGKPSWLRSKNPSKSPYESTKDFSGLDSEVAETLQNVLDNMQLPDAIRWRIQAAMPILVRTTRCSVSCQPPTVPPGSLALLQPSMSALGIQHGNSNTTRNSTASARNPTNTQAKPKQSSLQQEYDMEIDPWTLLEDGAGSGPSSSNVAVIGSGDHANMRALSWLKGTVRVRRTDLTYVGTMDDDS